MDSTLLLYLAITPLVGALFGVLLIYVTHRKRLANRNTSPERFKEESVRSRFILPYLLFLLGIVAFSLPVNLSVNQILKLNLDSIGKILFASGLSLGYICIVLATVYLKNRNLLRWTTVEKIFVTKD